MAPLSYDEVDASLISIKNIKDGSNGKLAFFEYNRKGGLQIQLTGELLWDVRCKEGFAPKAVIKLGTDDVSVGQQKMFAAVDARILELMLENKKDLWKSASDDKVRQFYRSVLKEGDEEGTYTVSFKVRETDKDGEKVLDVKVFDYATEERIDSEFLTKGSKVEIIVDLAYLYTMVSR
jgi:hypothetical protein